jgi:hypothetical protein
MVNDLILMFIFWAMLLAPCMVAMNVGVDRYDEVEEDAKQS